MCVVPLIFVSFSLSWDFPKLFLLFVSTCKWARTPKSLIHDFNSWDCTLLLSALHSLAKLGLTTFHILFTTLVELLFRSDYAKHLSTYSEGTYLIKETSGVKLGNCQNRKISIQKVLWHAFHLDYSLGWIMHFFFSHGPTLSIQRILLNLKIYVFYHFFSLVFV